MKLVPGVLVCWVTVVHFQLGVVYADTLPSITYAATTGGHNSNKADVTTTTSRKLAHHGRDGIEFQAVALRGGRKKRQGKGGSDSDSSASDSSKSNKSPSKSKKSGKHCKGGTCEKKSKSKDGKKGSKLTKSKSPPAQYPATMPSPSSGNSGDGGEPPVYRARGKSPVAPVSKHLGPTPGGPQTERTSATTTRDRASAPRFSTSGVSEQVRSTSPRAMNPEAKEDNENEIGQATKSLITSSKFNGPRITRNVYATPVYLKAHGTAYLEERDDEIFAVLQSVLTPYLEKAVGSGLDAYNLEIKYAPQPSESRSEESVFVTYLQVSIILEVTSSSVVGLKKTNAIIASTWLKEFFEGQDLYQFLGECRQSGCDITEMISQEDEFRHPVFDAPPPVSEINTGSSGQQGESFQPSNKKESKKVGLFAALGAGLFVVAAVLGASIQDRHRRRQLFSAFRLDSSFSDSSSRSSRSSSSGSGSGSGPVRPRTYSGTFRRHPVGGIKPAAIQKKPAFSETLSPPNNDNTAMSGLAPPSTGTPSFRSERSYSVAGDFNIPSEYDLKTSPLPDYSRTSPVKRSGHEEFAMPEEYSVVGTPIKTYPTSGETPQQQRPRGYGRDQKDGSKGTLRFNKGKKAKPLSPAASEDSSITATPKGGVEGYSNRSPRLQMSDGSPSPGIATSATMNDPLHDEWSVDSYSTVSQDKSNVPYRGWSKKKPANDLDMPPLT